MELAGCDRIGEGLERDGLGETKDAALLACGVCTVGRCIQLGGSTIFGVLIGEDHRSALVPTLILGDDECIDGILVAFALDSQDHLDTVRFIVAVLLWSCERTGGALA